MPETFTEALRYFITVRDGSPFMLVPVMLSYPFVLRTTIRV